MKRLFAVLLALALVLPVAALAETRHTIDLLGCDVIVPDGWRIETGAVGAIDFTHEMSQGRIVFSNTGMPAEDIDTTELSADTGLLLAGAAAISSGADELTPALSFDYSSDGRRIIGGSVTYEQHSEQVIMWAYMFTSASNTWASCSVRMPADGSLDISWILGAMEAMFPELADVQMTVNGDVADGSEQGQETQDLSPSTETQGEFGDDGQASIPAEGGDDTDDDTYEGEYDSDDRLSGIIFPITQGDKNEHVKAVQEKLIAHGYLSDTADGSFGKKTKAAVEKFQSENGFEASGNVNEETYIALMYGELE